MSIVASKLPHCNEKASYNVSELPAAGPAKVGMHVKFLFSGVQGVCVVAALVMKYSIITPRVLKQESIHMYPLAT